MKTLAIVTLILGLFGVSLSSATTTDDLIANCDVQVSDPQDPNAQKKPVQDGEVALGAAIQACQAAITVKADSARSFYQLGRAYHLARRYKDAFEAYRQAALQNYGPGLRAIGEAFAQGQGLPLGQAQDANIASHYYNKAIAAGDFFAQDSLDNLNQAIAASKFDETIFQDGNYMTALYTGNTSSDYDNRITFLAYLHGVASALMGDTVFFLDQDCQHFVFGFNIISIEFRMQKEALSRLNKNLLDMNAVAGVKPAHDMGTNDARTLMHRYSCKSPIVAKIAENIRLASGPPITVDKLPDIMPGPMGQLGKLLFPGLPSKK